VKSRVAVTGDALLRSALEDVIHMALGAFHIGVRTGQLEGSFRVIKTGFFPVIGCVATGAIRAEFALVGVIFSMTGGTSLWRTLENVIDMTFFTGDIGVRAGQLEGCLRVVKGRLFPVVRSMATRAICTELALVGVIFGMAGSAIRPGGLEVRQCMGAIVAGCAGNRAMLAGQPERILAVIEGGSKTVYSIVTGSTVCPICLGMRLHKRRVDLGVANITHHRIEVRKAGYVTSFACKIRAISHLLVSGKGKPYRQMWELGQIQHRQRSI